MKANGVKGRPLSSEQKQRIKEVWGRKYVNNRTFFIINSFSDLKLGIAECVPLDFFFLKLFPYFNGHGSDYKSIKNGKNSFDFLFPYIKQPETVIRRINNKYFRKYSDEIPYAEAEALCRKHKELVIKQSINSAEGKGVNFVKSDDYDSLLKDCLQKYDNLIVQTVIRQHPVLSSLNPSSVNGIRLYVLNLDGEGHILSSFLKVGGCNSRMDNYAQGGLECPLSADGRIIAGISKNLMITDTTESGVRLSGTAIPSFDKCKQLAIRGTLQMSEICRFMIWDFAIDEEGDPVLIEASKGFTGIVIDQITGRPWIEDPELRDRIIDMLR